MADALRDPLLEELARLKRKYGEEAFWSAVDAIAPTRGMPEINDEAFLDLMERLILRKFEDSNGKVIKTAHAAAKWIVDNGNVAGASPASSIKRLESKFRARHRRSS